jgi:hypothetical protein
VRTSYSYWELGRALALVAALAGATPLQAQLGASATITSSQVNGTTYHYSLVLHNTATTTIGTFWFSWIPGLDFMPVSPANVTFPSSWNAAITHGGPGDGYAVEWVASSPSSYLAAGQSLTGFGFDSTMTPAELAGFSSLYPTYPVLTSFVYIGAPLSDPGSRFLVANALQFTSVPPCRIMDTRGVAGPFGGPFLSGGSTRSVPVPTSTCGIPSSALAYSLNITVVPLGSTLGYLTAWPSGQTQPTVSTLNSQDGSVLANAAIVPAGTNGSIDVFATNDTELIIDIDGYMAPPTTGSFQFYPLTPCRILDTRNAHGTFGGPSLAGGTSRSFPIPSSGCGVPPGAAAYSFNVTVVPHGTLGYLTAWQTGQSQPLVSTLNSLDGTVLANAAIVPAGTNGAVSFYASDATDVIADINGYFAPPATGGLNFYTVMPCRVVDTRNPAGPFGGPVLTGGTERSFPLSQGACGLPSNAAAYSLNMTVVPSGILGYLTTWPAGGIQPLVSTLNALKGQIVANAAMVPAGTNGAVDVYVTNTTHVVIDTNGYFGQ